MHFRLSSQAIDSDLIKKVFGEEVYSNLNPPLLVDFRNCEPGEELYQNQCLICPVGTYTVFENTEGCKPCLENSECLGGN